MPTVPDWAHRPFADFIDFVEQMDKLVHLSMHAIHMFQGRPEMLRATEHARAVLGHPPDPLAAKRLARAESDAALAKSEVEHGFPLLHAQSTITLCSALETLARDVVAAWLENDRSRVLAHPDLKRLTLAIAEYEQLDEIGKLEFLLNQIEREVDAPQKQGVDRFECMLRLAGLDGGVDGGVRRTIFEMVNVRNVLAHRRGIADRRLVHACPWMGLQPGQHVTISHDRFGDYVTACAVFMTEAYNRVRVSFGVPPYVAPVEPRASDSTEADLAAAVRSAATSCVRDATPPEPAGDSRRER